MAGPGHHHRRDAAAVSDFSALVYLSGQVSNLQVVGQLRDIEQRIRGQDGVQLPQEIQALEGVAEKDMVPLSYTDELYALRANISLVRKKLSRTNSQIFTPSP